MDIEAALSNVDAVIANWSGNRQQRAIVEQSWAAIVQAVRAETPKDDATKDVKEPKPKQ